MTMSMITANESPSILVVEDDPAVLKAVSELLESLGFAVDPARSFLEAQSKLAEPTCDLVLLDLTLPDGDGLDLCRELRERDPALPIVVLTARDCPSQKIRGLDLGADDYVTKPFHSGELVARLRSVMRRVSTTAQGRLNVGGLWLDPATRTVGRGDHEIHLKPREFDLLHFLMQRPGRAWTRDQLLERVWGDDFEGDRRTVDSHVLRLRAKIETDSTVPRLIRTVWGIGYRMSEAQ